MRQARSEHRKVQYNMCITVYLKAIAMIQRIQRTDVA